MEREGFSAADVAVGGHRIRTWAKGAGDPVLLVHGITTYSVGYDYWPVQPITALRAPIVRELLMAALDLGALSLLVRRGVYDGARVTPELLELFARPLATAEGRRAFLHFARCLDPRDLTGAAARLAELPLPVLVVRGDADAYLPAVIAERLHRDLPRSRLVRIPRGGHFLQEDEPRALAEAILAFLPEAA